MTHSRLPSENRDDLPQEMAALLAAVEELPDLYKHRLKPLVAQLAEQTRRRREVLLLVQESLAQLRLDMKYLIFDLEATRRERDAYRRLVEGNK
jgi:hypothetical protein